MGWVIFDGLTLLTAAGRVMTPRTASEALVRAALGLIGDRPGRVVDVGTGSGAIAIAIATAAPQAQVSATDTSGGAVALARANVRRHGLGRRVPVYHGDLLAPVPGPVDVVVANLPYLPAARAHDYPDLASEPAAAVFAAGDGLGPYRRLLAVCAERLGENGAVALQLRRRVFTASRAGLPALAGALERHQSGYLPRLAAAAA